MSYSSVVTYTLDGAGNPVSPLYAPYNPAIGNEYTVTSAGTTTLATTVSAQIAPVQSLANGLYIHTIKAVLSINDATTEFEKLVFILTNETGQTKAFNAIVGSATVANYQSVYTFEFSAVSKCPNASNNQFTLTAVGTFLGSTTAPTITSASLTATKIA